MPMIGRAGMESRNSYSDIAIKRSEPGQGQAVDPKIGDELNKMVGVKPEQRFVNKKDHETLGKDGFMKLLAHQLKNQDPMKPMDQKDFSSNLAQFSQLEQLTAMNKKFDGLTANNDNEKRFQGASYLGKKVVTSGTTIEYSGEGNNVELPFHLDRPAKNAMIRIYDTKNQIVGKVDQEDLGKGQQAVVWDGIGLDGQLAPKDTYHFEVIAFDNNNEKFMGATRAEGTVTGVRFENGETILDVAGGKKVFLKDVESFSLPEKDLASKNLPALQKQAASAYNQVEKQNSN
ncbi:MAG: flagellar hook assembly protein FlgD [Alphaproteobacteria bacterium]|nr:MAG: flagellar hook assembly protein FlgD [Alphaproteobacteria bacterium]